MNATTEAALGHISRRVAEEKVARNRRNLWAGWNPEPHDRQAREAVQFLLRYLQGLD